MLSSLITQSITIPILYTSKCLLCSINYALKSELLLVYLFGLKHRLCANLTCNYITNTQIHTYLSVYFVLITCFKNSLGWRKAYWVKNLGSETFLIPSSTDSTIWSLLASCWMVASVELYTACVRSLLSVWTFSF